MAVIPLVYGYDMAAGLNRCIGSDTIRWLASPRRGGRPPDQLAALDKSPPQARSSPYFLTLAPRGRPDRSNQGLAATPTPRYM
jgi:hypothetical protein